MIEGSSVVPTSAESRPWASLWMVRIWLISSPWPLKIRLVLRPSGRRGAIFQGRWPSPWSGLVEAAGGELRAGRAEHDLRWGRQRPSLSSPSTTSARSRPWPSSTLGGVVADGDGLGGAPVARVAGLAGPQVLVAVLNAPPAKCTSLDS